MASCLRHIKIGASCSISLQYVTLTLRVGPDPLDSDPKALEPYRAPWHFYQPSPDAKQPTDCVPLPPLAVGEIPLLGESTRRSVVSRLRHLVISGCRAYHSRVPASERQSGERYITQYALPMFVLDLMEKGSTGYNTLERSVLATLGFLSWRC